MTNTLPAIADLHDMPEAALRELWKRLGDEMAPRVPLSVLRQMTAYRIQERRYGGLKVSVRRELERLARDLKGGKLAKHSPPQLSPGTRLLREWNGQTILVEVLEEGFRYDDKTWSSLSKIARHVTGAHRSGPRFFGLTERG